MSRAEAAHLIPSEGELPQSLFAAGSAG